LKWIASVLLALISASARADPTRWTWIQDVLVWSQQNAWVSIPVLAGCVVFIPVIEKAIGLPWIWDTVHALLDDFREHVFEKEIHTPLHYHRITLFKLVHFRFALCLWPWSRWLVPVARSGHTTQRSRIAFRVPDNADLVEGIAGQTWAQNQVVIVRNLPDINIDHSPVLLEEYARQTWVSVKWLQKRRQHALSFCGIPVEVKGKLWGVIVLDSRSPETIAQDPSRVYSLTGRYLGKLLERTWP
jgi:hypothetical protein